jgi:hypothetical protein
MQTLGLRHASRRRRLAARSTHLHLVLDLLPEISEKRAGNIEIKGRALLDALAARVLWRRAASRARGEGGWQEAEFGEKLGTLSEGGRHLHLERTV